ncbi:SDR family oxidoreductase [Photobacterium leiognathi]|uniref:SDR family oxidoreductase n=1 Tax=Photobacterium leiognathi TaxID=553611 RepID=UPI0029811461|nr:SDR family oxidoreductase [Photobacterium leiognathi]
MGKFTVFGGRGFIGSEFVKELNQQGHEVYVPERSDEEIYTKNLGTIIYSAGYGDCQKDPHNVLHANVILLSELLERAIFDKLVYISSTRVYMNQKSSDENEDLIICNDDSRRLFNLTKLTAEELCLKSGRNCLIIRPSNVYGLALNSTLFLPSIIKDAINLSQVDMYVNPSYSKDYVSVNDVVKSTLLLLAEDSIARVINIASGNNVTAMEIAKVLKAETNSKIVWHNVINSREIFPVTKIAMINEIIDYKFSNVLDDLKIMINQYRNKL